MHKCGVLAVAVILLVGCGGDEATELDEPRTVAAQLGCTASYEDAESQEEFVDEVGQCTIEESLVPIYTFEDEEATRTFVRAHAAPDRTFYRGATWAIEIPDSIDASYFTDLLEGEIVSDAS